MVDEAQERAGYLFDTNIVIALLSGDSVVVQLATELDVQSVPIYFSVITECEIYSYLKPNEAEHVSTLFHPSKCIVVTSEIARMAASMRCELRQTDRKLKTPDALIAATAVQHRLTLVSRDSDMRFIQELYHVPLICP